MYSFPYIILYITLLFLFFCEIGYIRLIKTSKAILIANGLIVFFIGLRGFVMTDFVYYYSFYNNLPNIFNLKLYDFQYEPGFILYSSLIKTFSSDYHIWVLINTIIDFILFKITIKHNSKSKILPYIVFLGISGLVLEFNLYRNAKAIFLFMYSIEYIKRRQLLNYVLINILAASFHVSALLFLPLYFILNLKSTNVIRWGIFVIVNVIVLFGGDFVKNIISRIFVIDQNFAGVSKFTEYISINESYGLSIGALERMLSFAIITCFYDHMIKENKCFLLYYNCYLIYYVVFSLFSFNSILVNRIPLLFVGAVYIVYSNVMTLKNKYSKQIMGYFLIILLFKLITTTNSIVCEYDNIIFGIKTYTQRCVTLYQNFDWY